MDMNSNYNQAKAWGFFMKETTWRIMKLATYKKQIDDAYRKPGRFDEATRGYATAQQLTDDAFASSDLAADTRTQLKERSSADGLHRPVHR
jgi:hypothetical protein